MAKQHKYEIKVNGSWAEVTHFIFRSWGGERRVDGQPFNGTVFYLGTRRAAVRKPKVRDAATASWLRKNGMIK